MQYWMTEKMEALNNFSKVKINSPIANIYKINTNYQHISKRSTQLKYLPQHVHNIKLIYEQVNYIYAACISPVNSHLYKQLKKVIVSFPNLITTNVYKYVTNSIASVKGHIDQ